MQEVRQPYSRIKRTNQDTKGITLTDIRENLGWLVGSIVTALALIFGWVYQSGVLSTLIGVAIGAGITYYVQTKTQNRAWKREYALKIAEEVYGNLFKEVKNIISSLEREHQSYRINFGKWKEFQEDHRYFMVDAGSRARLDDFCNKLDKYSEAAVKLGNEIRKIIMEETERIFGIRISIHQMPQTQVTYKRGYSGASGSPDIVQCLVSEMHPIDFVKGYDPEASDLDFNITVTSIDNKQTNISNSSDLDRFWQTCLKRTKENETYKFVTEENWKMLEDAKKLKKEIIERVEKPWKI